ncbi:type II toxin-antitoxin system HigB family toxin [Asticcacaulis sp. W401b]|uniref:type II toxin-antitoxin system HigB family toxin n=1 Tax=Asticcacaulis sp. W401b TaxID=3388666 RepID=UPI00397047F7
MRIIARNKLVAYWTKHPSSQASLEHWYSIAAVAVWKSGNDVMASFPKAKVLNAERVRFEIQGGNYRLIVSFHYGLEAGWIKFIGTHAEYDRIDVTTVDQF